MATVEIRRNNKGEITSFRLRQYAGRDKNGIEYPKITKSVKMPKGLSSRAQKKFIENEKMKFEQERKEGILPSNERFSDYSEYVLKMKESNGVKKSTLDRYKSLLDRINDAFGGVKLTDITVARLNEFYLSLAEPGVNQKTGAGLAPKTILEYHRLISTILETAYKEGLVTFNAAERATPPRQRRKAPEFFTQDELSKILKASDDEPIQWKALTYFFSLTGCRRGEALGLTWNHIDFNTGLVTISGNLLYSEKEHRIYLSTPKTQSSVRVIKVPEVMLDIFRELYKYQQSQKTRYGDSWHDTGLVWTRYHNSGENAVVRMYPGDPMHPDSVNSYYAKFGAKIGIKIHPHMFRHTLPSILIPEGIPVPVISKQLGHSEPAFTASVYTHIIQQQVAKAEETYSSILLDPEKNAN